jgi:polyhydroxyalkanoate synthase subunit PhaC
MVHLFATEAIMTTETPAADLPTLEDFQHWTQLMGRAQQLLMEFAVAPENREHMGALWQQWSSPERWSQFVAPSPAVTAAASPEAMLRMVGSFWEESLKFWQQLATPPAAANTPETDRRFAAPEWQAHPLFTLIRQSYAAISERMLAASDAVDGIDPQAKAQLRFATQSFIDAMSPSNFALTNPLVLKRTAETRGENLLKGLEHMLADMRRGQLTHVDLSKFTVGENIATTPGKVVHETPLFQLIHYTPTTEKVLEVPLVIFPPWINRFYILDLNPEKSFVRWCVEQGISTFIVSWKSADESMKDVVWDDYIAAQIEAIDVIQAALDVPAVHTIGYCVAGTTLAATLAILHARGEAEKVASATFFTAQVDFELAGDLKLMVDDSNLKLIETLSAPGYLDGRYMAASFNALRGRDLIWNYVVNNYLLGQDYPPFDLLYWNGDTTNLPATWHQAYLRDLYRDNRLVQPGSLSALGTPINLRTINTPTFIQAGREDHIAPPDSVWRMMDHLAGEKHFVLAGSGHIAGVVNPPSSGKYQYWTNDDPVASFADFVAGASETKGSWWPYWATWLRDHSAGDILVKSARIPGKGPKRTIEDAPGRYVKSR